jgi:hypothetical protein
MRREHSPPDRALQRWQHRRRGAQIDHFRKGYKVIAMDSRDQGKSGDSPDKLTYEKMTDDLAALLDYLKTGPVDVVGWSDGATSGMRRRSKDRGDVGQPQSERNPHSTFVLTARRSFCAIAA